MKQTIRRRVIIDAEEDLDPQRPGLWLSASLLQRVALLLLLACIVLVCWGLFASEQFFVSPAYARAVFGPGLALAVANTAVLYSLAPFRRLFKHRGGFVGTYLLIPPFLVAFCSTALLWPLPSLLNLVGGQRYGETYTVSDYHYVTGRKDQVVCRAVRIRELEGFWFGRLCVSGPTFTSLQVTDRITMAGKRSWFGVQVDSSTAAGVE